MKDATDLKLSANSCCVKEVESIAVISSTTCIPKQTMAKPHGHHVFPTKQQEIFA